MPQTVLLLHHSRASAYFKYVKAQAGKIWFGNKITIIKITNFKKMTPKNGLRKLYGKRKTLKTIYNTFEIRSISTVNSRWFNEKNCMVLQHYQHSLQVKLRTTKETPCYAYGKEYILI